MPGLDADGAGIEPQQIVPDVQPSSGNDPALQTHDLPKEASLHRFTRQPQRVQRGRIVTVGVQTVGAGVVRVVETELRGPFVHEADEGLDLAVAHVGSKCVRGVVGALHERRGEKVAHAEAFPGAQVKGRFADRRRLLFDPNALGRPRLLQRHQRGHDLRDAGHGEPLVGVELVQHGSGGVANDHRLRLDRRRTGR